MDTAMQFDDKYVSRKTIVEAGGKWDDKVSVFVFADGSFGGFTDIKNGAQERTNTGEPILHFAGHAASENLELDDVWQQ